MNIKYSDLFVVISTNKIQALTDFYSQLLQKTPDIHRPEVYSEFRLEKIKIGIFKPKPERQAEFDNSSSAMSLCLEVEDINKAIAMLNKLDCPPPGEIIEASHGKEIYAYDPTGNRLILHQSR